MKPDNDLVNVDGWSTIPIVKKKGSKGDLFGVGPIKNTLMLKSAKIGFKGILSQVNIQNSYILITWILFSFL